MTNANRNPLLPFENGTPIIYRVENRMTSYPAYPTYRAYPDTDPDHPSFSDKRVFAVPHTFKDANLAIRCSATDLQGHQTENGPIFIIVGSDVPDERLSASLPKLAERYGIELEQLQAARRGEVVAVRSDAQTAWLPAAIASQAAGVHA